MKKHTKKEITHFEKELATYLTEIKGVKVPHPIVTHWKQWDVLTVVGNLQITLMQDNREGPIVSLYGRFSVKDLVNSQLKKYTHKKHNPYSLKFNFHGYTPGECLREFKSEMEKLRKK